MSINRTVIVAAILLAAMPCLAQVPAITAEDYARAERWMDYNVDPLVLHAGGRPEWLRDDRFWYRIETENGGEFVLVDAARGMRAAAFDQGRLAAALSAASGKRYTPFQLPFRTFEFGPDEGTIVFIVDERRWSCELQSPKCTGEEIKDEPPAMISPDGKRAAFIRDYNLWVRDLVSGRERQLTRGGIKDYGYATDNAGWIRSDSPVLLWSPDSKRIATFRHDGRGVGEMYLTSTEVGHPTLQTWKYPLPGDDKIFMIERIIIDVDAARVTRLQMPADPHRSSLCDHVTCEGNRFADVQWSPDSAQIAFISTSRDHKRAQLRVADAASGRVRDVLEEKVETYFESGNDRPNWYFLPASNELIWFSERDNWGHLYLYDLATGRLKNRITTGEGNVAQLVRVDGKARTVYFLGGGKEQGRDPYFLHLYRVGFDGQNLTLLTPEDANHNVTISDSGRFFVDRYSRPDVPPVVVLRDSEGKLLDTLEKADISRLEGRGWKPPIPIVAKGRDGTTDLYGLMYRPTSFNEGRKYPLINHIYPGPQAGSVGTRSFSAARDNAQALAELGFIVVEIDGMGTPGRSKKFHDTYYGDMGDNTLPDQVAAMKDLARRYSWIDIDRVGIYGHSGGGYAAAGAMFRYPEFFKVGVSEAGNHDNRNYEDDWAEKWQGLLRPGAGGTTNYDNQANPLVARNLRGKLLLAHGAMDDNVPPSSTLLVVEELIKANKDFDLVLFPSADHGFGDQPYMVRRRWDYFVRHLLGAEPPAGYELRPPKE